MLEDKLKESLIKKGVHKHLVDDVINSGYIIRGFCDPFSGKTWESVSDKMFGSKNLSSMFDLDKFIEYIHGNYEFPELPKFVEFNVKSIEDINLILADKKRQHYIKEGLLSFRGQTSQYTYIRKIPSPVRADKEGKEISIFPGVYRQNDSIYSFNKPFEEKRSLNKYLFELEPNNHDLHIDSAHAYDIMRVEQHYATQTAGLDISFDMETAIFFATKKLKFNSNNRAYYEAVTKGNHAGVIYGFVFRDPLVKKTEYLIKDFDLFKTNRPERIIRQGCGLPLFTEYERNLAICDLDFIIYLDKDFEYSGKKTQKYMFPNIDDDKFYGKLLELKDKHPVGLSNIVEYEGSR